MRRAWSNQLRSPNEVSHLPFNGSRTAMDRIISERHPGARRKYDQLSEWPIRRVGLDDDGFRSSHVTISNWDRKLDFYRRAAHEILLDQERDGLPLGHSALRQQLHLPVDH